MRPLDGITVLSLEHAVSAPFCTRQLADYGARVIKVERPGAGDFARGYDTSVNGLSSYFVWLNRSKESLTLDLKQRAARGVLAALLPRVDVLVQNLGPGAASRLGLDYATPERDLSAPHRRRHLWVWRRRPVHREEGVRSAHPGRERLLSVTGTADTPSRAGVSIADIAAGDVRVFRNPHGAPAADTHGRGHSRRRVDARGADRVDEPAALLRAIRGTAPARTGASHPTIAPYGPHRAGDGRDVSVRNSERARVGQFLRRRARPA